MKGSSDRIQACTSLFFDGIVAVIDPEMSWVARWQRTCAFFFIPLSFSCFLPPVLTPRRLFQRNMCVGCTPSALKGASRRTSRQSSRAAGLSTGRATRRTRIENPAPSCPTYIFFLAFALSTLSSSHGETTYSSTSVYCTLLVVCVVIYYTEVAAYMIQLGDMPQILQQFFKYSVVLVG
jgi:Spt4/RpoE2 zinc finger